MTLDAEVLGSCKPTCPPKGRALENILYSICTPVSPKMTDTSQFSCFFPFSLTGPRPLLLQTKRPFLLWWSEPLKSPATEWNRPIRRPFSYTCGLINARSIKNQTFILKVHPIADPTTIRRVDCWTELSPIDWTAINFPRTLSHGGAAATTILRNNQYYKQPPPRSSSFELSLFELGWLDTILWAAIYRLMKQITKALGL